MLLLINQGSKDIEGASQSTSQADQAFSPSHRTTSKRCHSPALKRRCLQAHKLVVLADRQVPPRGMDAKDALFVATYEEGKNVSEDAVLQKVSASQNPSCPLRARSARDASQNHFSSRIVPSPSRPLVEMIVFVRGTLGHLSKQICSSSGIEALCTTLQGVCPLMHLPIEDCTQWTNHTFDLISEFCKSKVRCACRVGRLGHTSTLRTPARDQGSYNADIGEAGHK
jgi:hypothetical protein